MTIFLLDNSAAQRIARSETILRQLLTLQSQGHFLASCEPTRDEALFSARSLADMRAMVAEFASGYIFLPLRERADHIALSLRQRLFEAGLGRAAGVTGLLIAAVAIDHGATVLHYDRDFETIASVEPRLKHQWIVPAGTVD